MYNVKHLKRSANLPLDISLKNRLLKQFEILRRNGILLGGIRCKIGAFSSPLNGHFN